MMKNIIKNILIVKELYFLYIYIYFTLKIKKKKKLF